MSIKLSRWSQRSLKDARYVPVMTTFITNKGPNEGSIWFDKQTPTSPCLTVEDIRGRFVRFQKNREGKRQIVPLADFFKYVEEGRYILIGVTPYCPSHTVIPH